jgi:Ca2+-binding RTX toxin-like protein
VTGLTVTTAEGLVTTFLTDGNGLDVDPDPEKNGADYLYISESPMAGMGGTYAGLQLEKILISDLPLTTATSPIYDNSGFYFSSVQPVTPPSLIGGPGNDVLTGTEGADRMNGGDGNDFISARGGSDNVRGDRGNDVISAGAGNDTVAGGAGNDRLLGETGRDRLLGAAGNDLLDGGAGRDVLTGGAGGDAFVFGGGDRVTDFDALEGDQILFDAALGLDLSMIAITFGSTNTTIAYAGQTMTLNGLTTPFDLGNAIKFDYEPSLDFI